MNALISTPYLSDTANSVVQLVDFEAHQKSDVQCQPFFKVHRLTPSFYRVVCAIAALCPLDLCDYKMLYVGYRFS